MLFNPLYSNAFMYNKIRAPDSNECTIREQDGRLAYKKYSFSSTDDFLNNFEVPHAYQTIVLPQEAQTDVYVPPPPSIIFKPVPTTPKEKWDYMVDVYNTWAQYPELWSNQLYEKIRYFLAEKEYLNVSKKDEQVLPKIPGVVTGYACHPYQPLVAISTANFILFYSLPHYATGQPKYLRHERVTGINCIAFRPNAGNSLAVGYREGIAVWTIKNTPQRHPHLLPDFNVASNSWVSFLSHPELGAVTSLDWDSTGDSTTGRVGVWRMVGSHFSLLSHIGPVELVMWSPADLIFTSHAGGILNFWDKAVKQEISNMRCKAASFSPDGKYIAIATNSLYIYSLTPGKNEIAKCVFVEPNSNMVFLDNLTDQYDLAQTEKVVWSPDGQRIALSFSGLPLVSLYSVTQLNQTFTLAPIGYVNAMAYDRTSTSIPLIHSIAFVPNFDKGSLLSICYASGVVAYVPLFYQSTATTSSLSIPPPSTRPEVFAQPSDSTPRPSLSSHSLLPSPLSSPISGPILSPISSPGYKVLYNNPSDNIRSPGFQIGSQ